MPLTIAEAKELFGNHIGASHSFEVGKAYLIRTVTLYYTGRIASITDSDLVLEDAAWIPDTGRFSECLTTGNPSEVEPYSSPVIVPRGGIIDATVWRHPLPRNVK